MRQHARPHRIKRGIVGSGRQRNIELGSCRRTEPRFGIRTRARIQKLTILMNISQYHRRITLETVVHTIAVMRIDIDIGDSPQTVTTLQLLDGNAAIIEDAKASGCAACGSRNPCGPEAPSPRATPWPAK